MTFTDQATGTLPFHGDAGRPAAPALDAGPAAAARPRRSALSSGPAAPALPHRHAHHASLCWT